MSRGVDLLNAAVAVTNMIVPNSDIQILNFDKVVCRVIKFGKLNEITWKGKEGKADNTTQHIRIYVKVDSWFSAESQGERGDIEGKIVTINPRVAWLPEVVALQRALEESTGDKDAFFHHKITLLRKDRKLPSGDGRYGYIEVTDNGIVSGIDESEHLKIVESDDYENEEPTQPKAVQQKPAPVTQAQAQATRAQASSDMYAKCTTVEDAFGIMKKAYADESDGEKKLAIATGYRKTKDLLIAEAIKASPEPLVMAGVLNSKYYSKEQVKQDDLLAFAKSILQSRSAKSTELLEDDVPF